MDGRGEDMNDDPRETVEFHRLPDSHCPSCRRTLNAAGSLIGALPRPRSGDLSVCMHCLAVLAYGKDLELRLLSQRDINGLEVKELRALAATIEELRVLAATIEGLCSPPR